MKIHAYILAADPAWAWSSLSSYHHLVSRIFVSFDRDHRSWNGHLTRGNEAIRELAAAAPDDRIVLLPGDFSDPSRPLLELETAQRQATLDAAGEGADWVLQIDADEVVLAPAVFMRELMRADSLGFDALHFPARWLYQRAESRFARNGRETFLEGCTRGWGAQASYPGPVAVRSGTSLTLCRQTAASTYRVDFRRRNTDPAHPKDARVDAVIAPDHGILHYGWVRPPAEMETKSRLSGHASDFDWRPRISDWAWRGRHPWLTTATAPVRSPGNRFRVRRFPARPIMARRDG